MKVRISLAVVCATVFAMFVSIASAQQVTKSAGAASVAQSTASQATVYVYRYKQYVGKALSPSVYCDGTELARMQNGRYFVVTLAPGKHSFRSNDTQSGIDVDLKPGEKYYIRVELSTGFWKGHGRVLSVAPEQGSYEIEKLKPLDKDKVKDAQLVTLVSLESK